MGNKSNILYKHCVWKDAGCNKDDIRINLTFCNYKYSYGEKKQYYKNLLKK